MNRVLANRSNSGSQSRTPEQLTAMPPISTRRCWSKRSAWMKGRQGSRDRASFAIGYGNGSRNIYQQRGRRIYRSKERRTKRIRTNRGFRFAESVGRGVAKIHSEDTLTKQR